MTERNFFSDEIQISGGHSSILMNTTNLFKEGLWYIIQLEESFLINSYILSICSQSIEINSLSEKKFLIRINDSSLENYIKIDVPLNSSVIIKKLKLYILGLLDHGYNFTVNKAIQRNRFVDEENFSIPESLLSSSSFRWDGYFIYGKIYEDKTLIVSEKTYFRIISKSLSLEDFQQLVAWIKRTYRRSTIEIGDQIIYILGTEESSGLTTIITEDGRLLELTLS